MPQFTANAVYRFNPYGAFKFRLKWDGQYVAGLSKMSALKRTTEVIKHREGGDPSTSHKAPGERSTTPSRSTAASHTTPPSKPGPILHFFMVPGLERR